MKGVNVTVAPVTQAAEPAISLALSTSLNATSIAVGESLGTKVKVTGKLYKADDIKYVIVSGGEYAEIDKDGYITGKADGKVIVKAVATNDFGTFSSNEIEITVGKGEAPKKKKGCGSSVESGIFAILGLAGLAAIMIKKRKGE